MRGVSICRARPLPSCAVNAVQPGNVSGNTYDKYASKNPDRTKDDGGLLRPPSIACSTGSTREVVVEIGAGEGRITERLVERFPNATVVGLDLPDTNLAEEWDEIEVPMFFGDATRMPFVDDSIDLVVGLEVLEHVPRARTGPRRHRPGAAVARRCCRCPREPIWRAGNMARGRYVKRLRQHPGPRQPLVVESVRALRRDAGSTSPTPAHRCRGRWSAPRRRLT